MEIINNIFNYRKKRKHILPGFSLTLGYTMFYLSIIMIIPLTVLVFKTFKLKFDEFIDIVTSARVLNSYFLSFITSFIAALINVLFGFIVAWVLVRYKFPGEKLIDAMIDLPFALPTAVAGISLTTIFAPNGWIGSSLSGLGIKAVFTPLGIIIALTFISLPFVVRTVQPVLEDLNVELEEAAASLNATKFQAFYMVILPELRPALLTGFTLAFARSLGEYGSVVFISGNMPMKTEIAPLLIMTKLEQYDYNGAVAIAVVMMTVSFLLLLSINIIQWFTKRHK